MPVTKLVRIGTSFGVVVPKEVLRQLGWWQGDMLKQSVQDGQITLTNLTQKAVRPTKEKSEYAERKHAGTEWAV